MGPLNGYTVIELAGLGPAPMGAMMLADMGAEVLRIDRPGALEPRVTEPVSARGKKSVVLNLKSEQGREALLTLIENADVVIDPYRPGVCEKLGIGPEVCLERNPKLVFARMTGWGQTGPLAQAAGHDLNYIAITGALHAIGRRGERPVVPLNLIGDMGGGGMLLANGVLAALLEASQSGQGQVVDVAMVDGAAQLMWMMQGFSQTGGWNENERESNLLDGAAHFYDTYECADGKYVAIGSIEPQFYALLIEKTGVDAAVFQPQMDPSRWPEMKAALSAVFKSRSRDEWCSIMEGSDVCFAPVLTMSEATEYPANAAREVYIEVDGITQAAPAPRFSRTPSGVAHGPRPLGADTRAVLGAVGMAEADIDTLLAPPSSEQSKQAS